VTEASTELGKLVSTHAISPANMQRAAVVAVVSFLFFLAMLIVFYVRQHIGYFALSTAFLVVYVFTLIGWVIQRRSAVRIYEKGLRYKKFAASWNEIKSVNADRSGLKINAEKSRSVMIPPSITGYDTVVRSLRQNLPEPPDPA
jgi:uncharacterized membrane protein YobD (UPF0266 family)